MELILSKLFFLSLQLLLVLLCIFTNSWASDSDSPSSILNVGNSSSFPSFQNLETFENLTLSLPQDNRTVSTKQFLDDLPCIRNGHFCEVYIHRRSCCSGQPCKLFPNPLLQYVTSNGLGICH